MSNGPEPNYYFADCRTHGTDILFRYFCSFLELKYSYVNIGYLIDVIVPGIANMSVQLLGKLCK